MLILKYAGSKVRFESILINPDGGSGNTPAILYTSTYFLKNLKLFLKTSALFAFYVRVSRRKKHV